MAAIRSLGPGFWQLSLSFQGSQEVIGPYLLAGKNELALIDPGPTSTAEDLLEAVRLAGFVPEDVTHLLLTHIHLDHGGAVGTLLTQMPKATVYAHSKGAPHLIDPQRFLASATRIYGSRMQELWGTFEAVPAARLQAIDGGTVLTVAGRRLEVHYTPGHAIHHVVFFDVHTGELFSGDIAGVRLAGLDYVRPPTPPPDLDLEAWSASLVAIKRLYPDTLYLAHLGAVTNPTHHIDRLREKLISWGDFVRGAMRDGKSEAEIIQELKAHTEPDLLRVAGNESTLRDYDLATNYAMTVQGYMRYWQKHHPERL